MMNVNIVLANFTICVGEVKVTSLACVPVVVEAFIASLRAAFVCIDRQLKFCALNKCFGRQDAFRNFDCVNRVRCVPTIVDLN